MGSKSAEVGPQPAHKRAFRLSADRPRMTMRAGRQSRNAGSFLRKELGEALRNTENNERIDAVPPALRLAAL